MKYIVSLLTLLIISSSIIMAQTNSNKVFPYKYTTTTLDNGLKVVIIPMDTPGLVAYYSVVRTGSRDEWEPGKSGFAHFFEHIMFRGTKTYPGSVYDSIMTSIGADANAYTDNDLTVFHINFAKQDLERVIELEADRFQNLNYTKSQFQTESGAVYGEYRKGRTSPFSVAIEKLQDISFQKHTYKHTTIGFEKDIKEMPNQYEYSLSFYKRYYRPENVVILVVGDVNKENTISLIKKYYSDWKPGYVKPQITPEPPQKEAHKAEVDYSGRTLPLIVFGYKNDAFNVDNKNFVASTLLSDLAFGEISDIYKKLVLNEQKVQFIFASPGISRDPGLFYIYTMVKDSNDISYVENEILKTLDKFKNNLVDKQKLENLKNREKYSFLMSLNTPDNVAGSLPLYITFTGGIDAVDKYYNNMEKITPEDIMNAAKLYFSPERKNEVILKGEAK